MKLFLKVQLFVKFLAQIGSSRKAQNVLDKLKPFVDKYIKQ
jgi:hypothetical protein